MDNDLKIDKEEVKQLRKDLFGSVGDFLKRRWKLILVVLVVFYAISLAGNQEEVEIGKEITEKTEDNKEEEVNKTEPEVAQDPAIKPEEGKSEPVKVKTEENKIGTPAPVVEKKAEEPSSAQTQENKQTVSQKGAIQTAENYLRIKGFSRSGLIEQLKFEQFSEADATYAVDNIKIDYNEQAKKSAESYMSIKGFSRGGLIDQLKFEGFTQAQAEYGATAVGL
jgi:colicin import membrane protein